MEASTNRPLVSGTDYSIIAPLSIAFALVAIIISCFVLILVIFTKQLHTPNHLLACNTCVASILYCVVQCNNYIYILFIQWDRSDQSCRWRGYFGYMSVASMIYSYTLQAISRLFIIILSTKYRWLTSFKTHYIMIALGWTIVIILPLPAILTKDIYFREGFLCWLPRKAMLHIIYTLIAYYFIPVSAIMIIYIYIYIKIHRSTNNSTRQFRRRTNRDMIIFRNIMILFSIYIIGAIPSIIYMLSGVEFFFSLGIVSVTLAVDVEKLVSLYLDREILSTIKKILCQRTTKVMPVVAVRVIP